MLAYLVFAMAATSIAHRPHLGGYILSYTHIWLRIAACFALMIAARVVWVLVRERPERALPHALAVIAEACPPRAAAGMALFLSTFVFMGAFTTVKTALPNITSFWADPALTALDRAVHLGHDPWRLLQPLLGHPFVTRLIEIVYMPVWAAMVSTMLAWMCIFCQDERLRRRFLVAFLAAWIINGTWLAGLFLSGGPVYSAELVGDSRPFSGLLAYLSEVSSGPHSAVELQRALWATYTAGDDGFGAGISAFPSLHVTMATLMTLAGWSIRRGLGLAFGAFGAVILAGSVHLAWHYAVDGYAAIALTVLIWRMADSSVQP